MKRIALLDFVFLVFTVGFSTAQEQYRPIVVSIKPQIDVPLPPDPSLFQIGGGVAVSGSYVFPSFQPLSTGIIVNYHLGPLRHADLGNLGSLSVISAETTAKLRGEGNPTQTHSM